jgi:hypothetical protein
MVRYYPGAIVCLLAVAAACERADGARAMSDVSAMAAGTPGTAASSTAPECRTIVADMPLPDEVRETSGLARSRRDPGRFWTHNDAGNDAELFAVDAEGKLVQRVRVTGTQAADWEDLEVGPCESGDCLYVGDIGDNDAERERITIYRVSEPAPEASESLPAEALHARYPGGPRDAEALFVTDSGDLYLVTKGRRGPIALYRYPAPQRAGETVTLEPVRELFPEPADEQDRVTAATASPDGRWVGIRSYRQLFLYRTAELLGDGAVEPLTVDLGSLGHSQGESLVLDADGAVWVSTEAAKKNDRPLWAHLRCTLPA